MFCLKCKRLTSNKNENIEHDNTGRTRKTADCGVCGSHKSQYIKKQTGKGQIELDLSGAAYDNEPQREVGGFVLDEDLSNKKTRVFHNPETKEVKISHKGTDPTDKNDLKNDLLLSVGLLNKHTSQRVRNANKITAEANKKYGAENITHTGHSLGGYLASNSARGENKVETYNAGTSPLAIVSNQFKKKKQNAIHYTTGVDPISGARLSSKDKVVLVKPTKLNVHGLENFAKIHKK
jgi:hypothetical protein